MTVLTQYSIAVNGRLYQQPAQHPIFGMLPGETRPLVFDTRSEADEAAVSIARELESRFGLAPIVTVACRYLSEWVIGDPAAETDFEALLRGESE